MSRPKGSKNKPKIPDANPIEDIKPAQPTNVSLSTDVPMIGVEVKKKERKSSLPVKPDWILTKTANGTPIAIEGIIKCGSGHQLMVVPNYKEREQKTTVDSISVIKPEFPTPEIEKEFDGILWYVPPLVIASPLNDNAVPEITKEE